MRKLLGILVVLAAIAGSLMACGGDEKEPPQRPSVTEQVQQASTNTPVPIDTPPPTDTPELTSTPKPTKTPLPTATPTPKLIEAAPKSFALTLDDMPPGFSLHEERTDYTSTDYEPENINPEALEGLSAGYGVSFEKEGGLEAMLSSLVLIGNVNFVYDSTEAAQAAFRQRFYQPDGKFKQVSAADIGDETEAFTVTIEGAAEKEESMDVVAYVLVFRYNNVLTSVYGGALAGAGSFDSIFDLARVVEGRLNEISNE